MPKYQTIRTVPYAQNKIFNIMMDICTYPDILPFIKTVHIQKQTENLITASVTVGIGPLAFTYDCEITTAPHHTIEITATKGPFKNLYAKWSFKAISDNKTEVTCFLDSEFSSRGMEIIGGKMFAHQFQHAIEIFENHLKRLNRKRPP